MGKSLRVGKYVPKRKLRQVADFYTVYEATQVGLQRSVQLRILTTDLDEDATAHARFTYQFKSLAQLDHPGILRVHDIGVYEGGLFFVTDHRDSSSLRELLTTKGRFDSEFLLETTKSLARALAYLHGRGILHRDLRLDTVAYDRETESVYIDDFSLVRNFNLKALSQIGIREMLPFVRVPELELSIPFDEKTDLYLLGKLLYEAAKAEPLLPLSREDLTTPGKLAAPEIHGTDLPEDFIRVIQRCLEPHPLKRYRSAEELLGDLDKIEDRISMKSALVEMVESSRSLKIAQFRNIKKPEKEPSEESDPSVHDAETADHPETSDERKSSLEGEREATAGVTASHSHPLFPETKSLSPRPRPSPEQLKGAPTFMIFAFALGAIVGLAVFVASARRTMTSTKGLVATDFPGRSTTADSGLDDRP